MKERWGVMLYLIFARCRMSGIIGNKSRGGVTCNKGQDLDLDALPPSSGMILNMFTENIIITAFSYSLLSQHPRQPPSRPHHRIAPTPRPATPPRITPRTPRATPAAPRERTNRWAPSNPRGHDSINKIHGFDLTTDWQDATIYYCRTRHPFSSKWHVITWSGEGGLAGRHVINAAWMGLISLLFS